MRKPRPLLRRLFLNDRWNKGMAAIRADVQCSEDLEKDRKTGFTRVRRSVAADLTITDCNDIISLDFGLWNSRGEAAAISNVLNKTRILRDVVNEFCDRVEAGVAWMEGTSDG